MANLSNTIEIYIKQRLQSGLFELKRNELAVRFGCAPSQINYVLATRFGVEKGYTVTSRRGGGGGIRIQRIDIEENDYVLGMITGVLKEEVSVMHAQRIIEGLVETGMLSGPQGRIAAAAVSQKALKGARVDQDGLRANILKQILVAMLHKE
jgi:transcriptional regulator CtsR